MADHQSRTARLMSAVALSLPPSVQRRVRPLGARAYEAAVDAGVKAIREGSRWPVDTGRSLRAWRRTGSGYSSRLYNPVSYASYVEGKGGPAASTLRSSTSKMIAAARRHANTQSPQVNERAAERLNVSEVIPEVIQHEPQLS